MNKNIKNKKQENIKKAVSEKYAQIFEEVKEKHPSLKEWKLQKKADKILAEYITSVHEWTYNFPKIFNSAGELVPNPLQTKEIHRFTKPHYALNPGSLIALNFIVNLSVPTSADTPYGLKFNFYGFIMSTTPAVYLPDATQQVNTYNFGDDFTEFSQIAEAVKEKMVPPSERWRLPKVVRQSRVGCQLGERW